MHGLLRQYAVEKLNASLPARDEVHNRHCRYYIDFLSQREADLTGQRMFTARDEVRQEMENVRSAVNWAVVHWEGETARRVLTAFLAFYTVQAWHEGKDSFRDIAQARKESLLSRNLTDVSKDPVYLSARVHQAFLLCNLGQIDESEAISRECLEPLYALGLKEDLSECLQNLGVNASFRGDYERARERLEEAILLGRDCQHFVWPTYLLWLGHVYFLRGEYAHGMESFRKCYDLFDRRGNLWGIAFALTKMGLAADGLEEFPQAMQYHRQALSIFEKTGNQAGKAYAKSRMSMGAYFLEEYPQAAQFGQEGYDIFQLLGHRWGICTSLCRLGFAFIGLGDIVKAKGYFNEALEQSRQNQMTPLSLYALAGLAATLAQEGEEKTAIELLRYVQRHPQTPALYVEQAARWFVYFDQTSAQNGSPVALENVEMDEVINRLLSGVALHSTVEPD
jgi:tetratricopeptide (TPR) repeat protein